MNKSQGYAMGNCNREDVDLDMNEEIGDIFLQVRE